MDDRDRSEEARLEEIRRRAQEIKDRERGAATVDATEVDAGVPARTVPAERIDARRGANVAAWRRPWTPRTHVFERTGCLIVRVELPGIDAKDAAVHVEDDTLVVEGERQDDRPEDAGSFRTDWGYGPFRSEVTLPFPVDAADLKARFRNGVLEVAVPRVRRDERRQRITIET